MPAPAAFHTHTRLGLSFTFKDRSVGVVNSYLWNFGDGTTSVEQNPPVHTYSVDGIYEVSLTVANSQGSNTYSASVLASLNPGLTSPISQMVRRDLPAGIIIDDSFLREYQEKWMLYLQEALEVSDADVFDELKWRPLARVLIAKLIIYDLIVKAAESSMTAFIAAQQQYNNNLTNAVTTQTLQVADYSWEVNIPDLLQVGNINNLVIRINGADLGPSGLIQNVEAFESYLNAFGKGQFIYDHANDVIKSLSNSNILDTISFQHTNGLIEGVFVQSNIRVVPINQTIEASGGTTGQKGPIKAMEAGPSKVEWYDASTYWSNLLKGSSLGGLNGAGQGGILGILSSDICIYGGRLGIRLPMCPPRKTGSLPIVSYNQRRWERH